jgi:L-malate glycosyltransferase
MKVAHIISVFAAGGAETFVRDLSQELQRIGIDCEIWSMRNALRYSKNDLKAMEFEKSYTTQVSKSNLKTCSIDMGRYPNPLRDFFEFKTLVKKSDVDIIHAHLFYGVLYSVTAAPRIPLVFTHHSSKVIGSFFHRVWFKSGIRKYVAISHDSFSQLREQVGVEENKICTIFNGILLKHIDFKKDRSFEKHPELSIIAVGRFWEQKNYPMMLHGLRIIIDRSIAEGLKPPTLSIVGDGPLRSSLEDLVRHLGIVKKVRFLGIRKDVPELLFNSDIFAMTSLWEGMSISILEALAAGLPIVATKVGGNPEIIEDGVSGILVPKGDAEGFAEAVLSLLRDPAKRTRMSVAARERVKDFSIEAAAAAHKRLYTEILGQ